MSTFLGTISGDHREFLHWIKNKTPIMVLVDSRGYVRTKASIEKSTRCELLRLLYEWNTIESCNKMLG
jgi:hypothetical protein